MKDDSQHVAAPVSAQQSDTSSSTSPDVKQRPVSMNRQDTYLLTTRKTGILNGGKRRIRYTRLLKAIGVFLTILFGYYKLLQEGVDARISHDDALLVAATAQMDSNSEAVRAAAVRTIFEIAFRDTPEEPHPGAYAPPIDLWHWLANRRIHRNLERCRDLFHEYASSPRRSTETQRNQVSTAIVDTAIKWVQKEHELYGTDPRSPSLWFLYRAKLSKAYVPTAQLQGVQFGDADLSFSVLSNSDLSEANLQGANIRNAQLDSANLTNSNLVASNLQNARLSFAKMEGARFADAQLIDADLTLIKASNVDFTRAVLDRTVWKTADLRGAKFSRARLRNADFAQADLSKADFQFSDLRGADFRYANNLYEVRSWQGAITEGALFPEHFSIVRRTHK